MADLDLATILADGEYLKREGDTLVGEIPSAGGSPEDAVDAVAAALVEGAGIDIVYDDTANTITVASTVVAGPSGSTILNGTVPPDPAVGAVGNYYEDTAAGILYGPKSASGWGAEQRITVAGTPPDTNDSGAVTRGVRVRFGRAGRITKIRYSRLAASGGTQTLNVWSDGGTKLAEVTDTQSTTGTFTATLSTPVPVTAGQILVASTSHASSVPIDLTLQAVTNTADCTFLEFRNGSAFNVFPDTPIATRSYFVEPVFEPDDAWPVTVRQVAGYASTNRTVVPKAGTPWVGLFTDAGCYLRFTGTNPTYTVPPNSAVAFPVGTQIDGIGTATAMTIIQGAGVTINRARTLVTLGAKSGWTLIKVATDEFDLHGDFV